MGKLCNSLSPSNSFPRTPSDWSRGVQSQTEKNSRRLPLRRRLDLPSWASLVSSSSLSTSPSTTLLSGHKDGSLPQTGGGPSPASPSSDTPIPVLYSFYHMLEILYLYEKEVK